MRLRKGELIVEQLTSSTNADLPGAMLHDWRGTAFVAGGKAADFERLMKDFNAYPQHYSPQVIQAKTLSQQGDHFRASMRVRQKHVITVVMDTVYDITFERLDPQHGFSISRSTEIDEIDSPGTRNERTLKSSEEHGFLWRLNTYWSFEERDGGLYMQIESVSLTRSIPNGLGWIIGPFVKSVPRESLEFTLRSTCDALRQQY
jgi:ribosome-associated toxin RatA of RatAB toxin-antitoxin module